MTSLYQAMLSQTVMGQLPSMRVVSQFSHIVIRLANGLRGDARDGILLSFPPLIFNSSYRTPS